MARTTTQLIDTVTNKIDFTRIFLGAVVILTIYIVLVPLIFLLWNSFHGTGSPIDPAPLSLHNYIEAYSNPKTYKIMVDTFIFAVLSVAIGLGLGICFAWLLERTNVPFKTLLYSLVPLPIVIPGMLLAMAWVLILSPRIGVINLFFMDILGMEQAPFSIYTMGGMAFVEGLRLVPTMFLMMVGAFKSMDPALEEAGSTSGAGILSTLRRITGPLMLPAILSALIYCFTIAIEAFEIPGIIGITAGIQVFSTKIYLASRDIPVNYSLAAAFAIAFVVISLVLMLIYSRMTRQTEKYTTITGKGYRPRVIDLGSWKYVGFAIIVLYLIFALVLPALILLWAALLPFYIPPSVEALSKVSLDAFTNFFSYPNILNAFVNSFVIMVAVATFTAILGSLIAWMVVRTRHKGRQLLDMLTFLPLGVPSMVIGLALLIVYLKLNFIPIYNTIWIIMLAYVTRFMTFPTRTMNAAMHQLHKELEEAASVSGASWWTMFTRITLPLLMPSFVSVWVWTAMMSIREVSAALLLSGPRSTVISVVIWDRWIEGGIPQAAALGVVLIAIAAVIMVIGRVYGFRIGRQQALR